MTAFLAAVLLGSAASAAPAPAPAVKPSTSAAAAPVASIGASTYTVSTLYTGDRVRDPFLPPSVGGGPSRPRRGEGPTIVDIHALQLRGIMKDAASDFALFGSDTGLTLILRGGRLYDDRNKRVPGITGRIQIKQKRAELITEDKDVQVFSLGETGDEAGEKGKSGKP